MKNSNSKIRIAIDAMGSDNSPYPEIEGATKAKLFLGEQAELILVGNKEKINQIRHERGNGVDLTLLDTKEVVTMNDDPVHVIKNKKESSLYKSIELIKLNKADASVSAGNTGAIMVVSANLLGRISGVSRPTVGSMFPTTTEYPALVMDVGANVNPKASFLMEFAQMGAIYYSQLTSIKNPTISILNIGEEPKKGTDTTRELYEMLSKSDLNFVGNIEGRDILKGKANIIITDGFTGNVVLKLAESFFDVLKHLLKEYSEKSLINKLKTALMIPVFKDALKSFDYEEYGGVPLLGVNGVVYIGHGKSSSKALKNMILNSFESVKTGILQKIENQLKVNINS